MNPLVKTLTDWIDTLGVSYISSVDQAGYPNTKAMLPPVKREGLKTFYWHTNSPSMRVAQYRENPKACLYFCDPGAFRGLMLRGTMEVVDDPATKWALWQEGFDMYYEGGVDGGDYILLRFTAQTGRYDSDFHSEDVTLCQHYF